MRRVRRGPRRATALAAGLLAVALAGCGTSDAEEEPRKAGESPRGDTAEDPEEDGDEPEEDDDETGGVGALPDAYDFTPDPDLLPTTAAEARALMEGAHVEPDIWWPGLAPDDPHEVAGTWTVLGDDCDWSRAELPDGVLDSLTRRYQLPATDDLGQALATVTVSAHRDDAGADAEMAATLDESYRCPDQELGDGQRLSGLMSLEYPEEEVLNADASLFEMGQWTGPDSPVPYSYLWVKSRIGPVTASVAVKGGPGHEDMELMRMAAEGLARVLYQIELELT
ncbi:hypothetical protein [Streptomyces profundus]|uniref:hypothetical protein n=1 Tax=Streptomyces profundus TaxID=2867410 RepID=UPI001D16C091|nr:hypothetical protein [Streptomyces sp. MA3_2.13]UED87769.1 hypothetical protein K4G22_29190 [Streptomyces sp. MA3_2.13]